MFLALYCLAALRRVQASIMILHSYVCHFFYILDILVGV